MATSYNKLWKLLIDKGMRKKDLLLAAGISSSAQSTLAEAVKPDYWIPEWWQSGLILIAWAAAAWIGGLIITGKADIRYQITRVTALAVLPVRPWSWQFVMAMALAVLQ